MTATPYDLIAAQWQASGRQFKARKYVDLVIDKLPPGARILDLGCGTGVPIAQYLVNRGFQVVGVDESSKMLELAKRNVPRADFVQADIEGLNLYGRFAAAIVWDSIFHIERTHHQEIFRRLVEFLDSDGWLLLSSGGSGHDGFTSEMHGQTFFYSSYDPSETVRLLGVEGFHVELCEVDDLSSRGHVAIVARRAS
jgi:SAM-dependent methyltransferase